MIAKWRFIHEGDFPARIKKSMVRFSLTIDQKDTESACLIKQKP
jgi:hypothetical protein